MTDTELKLLKSFPRSFINGNGEFIAHGKANEYFVLHNCKDDFEINCKVLEWLSRASCKTEPYYQNKKNTEFHRFMLNGINAFLGTDFSSENMELIYTKLGNNCNRPLCEKFVASGYDMKILEDKQ